MRCLLLTIEKLSLSIFRWILFVALFDTRVSRHLIEWLTTKWHCNAKQINRHQTYQFHTLILSSVESLLIISGVDDNVFQFSMKFLFVCVSKENSAFFVLMRHLENGKMSNYLWHFNAKSFSIFFLFKSLIFIWTLLFAIFRRSKSNQDLVSTVAEKASRNVNRNNRKYCGIFFLK